MDSLDLRKITDFDFEILCKDMLEEALSVPLEIFAPGADAGVDLRRLQPGGQKLIIQCKHWMKTDRSALIRHMEKIELPKIRKLAPDRYILMTTADLTKAAKDRLFEILQPYVKTPGDIYGLDEVTHEIRKRPEIIRRHIRLWLNDPTLLDAAISRNILWRSQELVDDLPETLRTYAPNANLYAAQHQMEAHHVCILAGPPGIGKTTLAQVLAAHHVKRGYELIEISQDVEEVNRVWEENARQFFYYDDFLGQTTLGDKLNKNEDSRLLSLMRRVHRDPNKRLVLTTREYILAQAKQEYERFSRENLSPYTCIVRIDGYTRQTRAHLIYNHISLSGLDNSTKARFAQYANYSAIIDHPNFNPRIIASTFKASSFVPEGSDVTPNELLANLDDPTSIWRHIYENQLNEFEQRLVRIIFTLSSGVNLSDLLFILSRCGVQYSQTSLRNALQRLEGTFLELGRRSGEVTVKSANPSVIDFMRIYVSEDRLQLQEVIRDICVFEQLRNIWITAHGRGGEEIKRSLYGMAGELQDAAISVLNERGLRSYSSREDTDQASRAVLSLNIAEKLGLPRLAVATAQLLKRQGCVYDAWDREDIGRLIVATKNSRFQSVRARHHDVYLEGLTSILNRRKGVAGIFDSSLLLEPNLESLMPDALVDSIHEEAVALVEEIAERVIEGQDVSWEEFDAAVSYARSHADYDETWPTLLEAIEEFRYEVESSEDGETGTTPESDGAEWSALEFEQINRMMSTLADSE
ncbi:restriction endonuclease [Streptomyces sp. NPDC090493]|uniref:nSTAND3 domain-containing NTPase n=1 Tax=Streptomyces sp. NPDC090493 TaxID=3365964 RepID=UPI00381DA663